MGEIVFFLTWQYERGVEAGERERENMNMNENLSKFPSVFLLLFVKVFWGLKNGKFV